MLDPAARLRCYESLYSSDWWSSLSPSPRLPRFVVHWAPFFGPSPDTPASRQYGTFSTSCAPLTGCATPGRSRSLLGLSRSRASIDALDLLCLCPTSTQASSPAYCVLALKQPPSPSVSSPRNFSTPSPLSSPPTSCDQGPGDSPGSSPSCRSVRHEVAQR